MSGTSIRIATRSSPLALWQASHVAGLLRRAAPDRDVDLVHVTTTGDRRRTEPLHQLGSLGVFTRGVQEAVLEGRADLAVHSLKDLPTEPIAGLVLAAVPERASMFDVLVLPESSVATDDGSALSLLNALPPGARVGTGSIRRRAQLLLHRPDLRTIDIRGNVETRAAKLDEGDCDALVLAEAGLRRLGLDARISAVLRPPLFYPAVGQGALGLECRADDDELRSLLEQIGNPATMRAVAAERRLLAELRAGCHAPLGVCTASNDDELSLEAVVLDADGRKRLHASATGPSSDPEALGCQVAALLREQGAEELVAQAERK